MQNLAQLFERGPQSRIVSNCVTKGREKSASSGRLYKLSPLLTTKGIDIITLNRSFESLSVSLILRSDFFYFLLSLTIGKIWVGS